MPDTDTRQPEDVRRGATIRALREAHGLSGAELGRLIGVSQQLVSFIENGDRHASVATCRDIAGTFKIPLAAITIEGVRCDDCGYEFTSPGHQAAHRTAGTF